MERNEALSKLAKDLRPLLREISEKFISGQGWVGILFDLGVGQEFVAFAEAVEEGPVISEMKKRLEYDEYVFGHETHLFRAAFRRDIASEPDKWHGGVKDAFPIGRDELNHKANQDLRLTLLPEMYGLTEDALPFPLFHWRLAECSGTRQAVYLYFYDIFSRYSESPWSQRRAAGARSLILYVIKSLLTEFEIIYPHSIWGNLKGCMPEDFGFTFSLKHGRDRAKRVLDEARHGAILSLTHYAGNTWEPIVVEPLREVRNLITAARREDDAAGRHAGGGPKPSLAQRLIELEGVVERAECFVKKYVDHCGGLRRTLRPRDTAARCAFPGDFTLAIDEVRRSLPVSIEARFPEVAGWILYADEKDIQSLLLSCCGNAFREMEKRRVRTPHVVITTAVDSGGLHVRVWNAGTSFGSEVMARGGIGPYSAGAASGRTGLGLFCINLELKRLGAVPPDPTNSEKCMRLENCSYNDAEGAQISFLLCYESIEHRRGGAPQ